MATISKRGTSWFVQIRRKGFTPLYKSFATKGQAQTWATEQEGQIDAGQGTFVNDAPRRLTLRDLLAKYITEITPRKKGALSEIARLTKMQRSPMCSLTVQSLRPSVIAAYRNQRLTEAKPGTVRRELATLRHVLLTAKREWGISVPFNPAQQISLPIANDARDRRLNTGDLEQLLTAINATRNKLIKPIILLAIETGLRRGEILALNWRYISLESRTAHIPVTKTNIPRTIPLTDDACAILRSLSAREGMVFELSANALRQAWERLRNRAGLNDLRFHDLRHEAISRFCEMGLSIPEVSAISGHRDPRMLFRYLHLRPETLARKLEGRKWEGAPQPYFQAGK